MNFSVTEVKRQEAEALRLMQLVACNSNVVVGGQTLTDQDRALVLAGLTQLATALQLYGQTSDLNTAVIRSWQPYETAPRDGREIEVRKDDGTPCRVRWSESRFGRTWHLTEAVVATPLGFHPTEWRNSSKQKEAA